MMATAKHDSSYSNLSPLESGSRCQFRCMSLLPYLDESPQLLVPSGGGGRIDESDVPPWQKDLDIKWLSWRTDSKTCMYKTYHNLHWLHLATLSTLSNFIRDAGIWPTRRLKDPLLHWQCMCHGHHSMPSSRAAWKVEKWRFEEATGRNGRNVSSFDFILFLLLNHIFRDLHGCFLHVCFVPRLFLTKYALFALHTH